MAADRRTGGARRRSANRRRPLPALAAALCLSACAASRQETPAQSAYARQSDDQAAQPALTLIHPGEIPLREQGGALVVPVSINGAITLDFVVDSGSADVSIPADVILTLMRTGTIRHADFLGKKNYQLADGSTVPSELFRIRALKVGSYEVHDVTASAARVSGNLLLGQGFLRRFKSWSIDNTRRVLILTEK